MANEDAKFDGNYVPALLVEDEETGEVRALKGTEGGVKVAGRLTYLSAEVITGTPVAATIPADATVIVIQASTAVVTYTLNGAYDANACGYLAVGGQIKIGPLSGLTSLNCNSAGNIHILYFREG
jgi:hypothetical protein